MTLAVPDVNEPVRFTSTSTDPDGDTIREQDIDWDLDNDGAYDDGSGTTIERPYPTAGVRTVGLRCRSERSDRRNRSGNSA